MTHVGKLLLLVLMLLLPLQGVAASVMPLLKSGSKTSAGMPCHEHQAARPAAQQAASHIPGHTAPADNTSDGDATSHLCCHLVFTGAPAGVVPAAAHKFADVSRFVLPLATLYIPDSPDRPPRG